MDGIGFGGRGSKSRKLFQARAEYLVLIKEPTAVELIHDLAHKTDGQDFPDSRLVFIPSRERPMGSRHQI